MIRRSILILTLAVLALPIGYAVAEREQDAPAAEPPTRPPIVIYAPKATANGQSWDMTGPWMAAAPDIGFFFYSSHPVKLTKRRYDYVFEGKEIKVDYMYMETPTRITTDRMAFQKGRLTPSFINEDDVRQRSKERGVDLKRLETESPKKAADYLVSEARQGNIAPFAWFSAQSADHRRDYDESPEEYIESLRRNSEIIGEFPETDTFEAFNFELMLNMYPNDLLGITHTSIEMIGDRPMIWFKSPQSSAGVLVKRVDGRWVPEN